MLPMIYGLIAGVLWGFNPVVIKKYGEGLDTVTVNGVRAFYAFLLTLIITFTISPTYQADFTGLMIIFLSALSGPFLGDIFYVKAIRGIGGGNAITIGYMYVFVAEFISILILGETPDYHILIGTLLAVFGVSLIYKGYGSVSSRREYLSAFLTAVFWGFSTIFSRLATLHGDPFFLTVVRNLYVFTLASSIKGSRVVKESFSRKGFILGFLAGGLSFGLGMALFIKALSIGGVQVSALPTLIAPVVGRVFSIIVNEEKPDSNGIIGTFVTVLGLSIGFLKTTF